MIADFPIAGTMLIGTDDRVGAGASFTALNPASGVELEPAFRGATETDVADACVLAAAAFDEFRCSPAQQRAELLEQIADRIASLATALIDRANLETGLPKARLEGERARTIGQLRLFASELRAGRWSGTISDPGDPGRQPLPKPDLKTRYVAIGPVAVFGASNFPLAFSVAGGDTASALAAGCPVVFKGHPAHPGTSELVGRAVRAAVLACCLPPGVFSLLVGADHGLGAALVLHPEIKAVAFTGSRRGGTSLMALAATRKEPIPVYAEMGSINPVFLLPAALAERAAEIGSAFVGSLTMGAGQFCTNPGLVVAVDGPDLERFLAAARAALQAQPAMPMLSPAIHEAYERGVSGLIACGGVSLLSRGTDAAQSNFCNPALFVTDAARLMADPHLSEEVFGASSIVVRCADTSEMMDVVRALEGQLTATVHWEKADLAFARELVRALETKAGRILVNGWPTGVEVSPAMVHGGPFPASSDSRSTSVGTLSAGRFLRHVCYQDFPADLLTLAA